MAKTADHADPQSSLLIDARSFALRLNDTGVIMSIQFELIVQVYDISLEISHTPAPLTQKHKKSLALKFAKLCSSFHSWAFTEIDAFNLLTKLLCVGQFVVLNLSAAEVRNAFDALPTSKVDSASAVTRSNRTRIQNVLSHFSNLN